MSVEVGDGAVIPNYVICFLYFSTQVELGGYYSHRRLRRKPALTGEAEKLRVAVAGDDDDAVELPPGACLVEERDVNEQPFPAGARGFGKGGPAGADDGMEDGLQRLSPALVGENERPQFHPVGVAGGVACFAAECGGDGVAHGIVRREQVMHAAVGIEMTQWQLLAQKP